MNLTRRAYLSLAALLCVSAAFPLTGCPSSNSGSSETSTSGTTAAGSPAAQGAPTKLILGFVPSAEADKIAEDGKPMAEAIQKATGIPCETFTSTDYVGLIEAMKSGKCDIGSLPPLAYVLAKDQDGAEVILKTSRKKSLTYKSMFVVRADSGIKTLDQAKGKRMAFVDPSSASGYLFPAAYLKGKGYDPNSFFSDVTFAGAHDKAVQSVYNKDVDIAAVYDDARNKLEKTLPDIKTVVVPIERTTDIPNDTIAVRPTLPADLKEKIKKALVDFSKSPEGAKTLFDVYEVDALADAKDSDYDSVREVAKSMDVQLNSFKKDSKPSPAASPAKP